MPPVKPYCPQKLADSRAIGGTSGGSKDQGRRKAYGWAAMAGFFEAMQRFGSCLSAFLAVGLLLLGPASAADLLDVRFGPNGDATRIVFDLKGAPDFAVSGDETGAGRIFVDFAALNAGAAGDRPGKGHIANVSFAKRGEGYRAVLAMRKTAKIKEIFLLEPKDGVTKHRLVIDLLTADKPAFLASLPSQYGDLTAVIEQVTAGPAVAAIEETPGDMAAVVVPPAPSRKDSLANAAGEKWVIVIDPGHGGRDPGAQGQSGTLEKVVNLQAAKKLKSFLEAKGRYEVVLTRDGDDTIRPDRREAMAREAGADLFISLHADALEQPQVRGASVYTLSEEGSARSASLAKSQGNYRAYDLDLKQFDSVVGDILLDKAQDTTMTNSSKLAQILVANLTGKTPMLNRSHRTADLRVLLAPDVPAVLLEMAFISNAKDEANLISPVWRKRVMTAVADSIDAYFEAKALERHAQLAPGAAQ